MRLSTIKEQQPIDNLLNYICGSPICESYDGNVRWPILFVEAVDNARILSEEDADAIVTLFKAGMAKIQSALAPQTDQDLGALLSFVAPQGGGLPKIEQLVRAAKSSNQSIIQNQQWWDELFRTFNIVDPDVKQTIIGQVAADVNEAQPTPAQSAAQPVQPVTAQPTTTQPTQSQPAPRGDQQSLLKSLQQQQQQLVGNQDKLAELLTKTRQARLDHTKRLEALHKRLQELTGQQTTESLASDYITVLLEFPQVRAKLSDIIRNITSTPINEAGLADRTNRAIQAIPGFFRNLTKHAGELASNPRHAATKYGNLARNYTNERAAKLAVRILTDNARQAFATKLKQANATPQQIIADLGTYTGFKNRLSSAGPGTRPEDIFSPQELDQYKQLVKKLTSIYLLFNPKPKTKAMATVEPEEEPVEAELVDEEPIEAQPPSKPNPTPLDRIISSIESNQLVNPFLLDRLGKYSRENRKADPQMVLRQLVKTGHLTLSQARKLWQQEVRRSRNFQASSRPMVPPPPPPPRTRP